MIEPGDSEIKKQDVAMLIDKHLDKLSILVGTKPSYRNTTAKCISMKIKAYQNNITDPLKEGWDWWVFEDDNDFCSGDQHFPYRLVIRNKHTGWNTCKGRSPSRFFGDSTGKQEFPDKWRPKYPAPPGPTRAEKNEADDLGYDYDFAVNFRTKPYLETTIWWYVDGKFVWTTEKPTKKTKVIPPPNIKDTEIEILKLYLKDLDPSKFTKPYDQSIASAPGYELPSYYLLGADESETRREIQKKYKKLAFKYHPDKWSQKTLKQQEEAKIVFQKLSAAWNYIQAIHPMDPVEEEEEEGAA